MKTLAIWTAVMAVAASAQAHPHHPHRQAVEMELLVNGRSIGRSAGGSGTSVYVPVRKLGCEYVIRVRNRLSVPVEAVVSVDGLSVINGRRASDSIRGYLIQPRTTVDIPGWRRGDRKVAAFTFSREEDSYAYRTGRPDGIGIIRLAAFEQARPIQPMPATREVDGDWKFGDGGKAGFNRSSEAKATTSGHRRGVRQERIGTGYGRELDHHVSSVPFQRSHRVHRMSIHYGPAAHYEPFADNFTPPPPARR